MWQFSHPRNKWPPYLWHIDHAETQALAGPETDGLRLIARAAHKNPITGDDMDLYAFLDAIAYHIALDGEIASQAISCRLSRPCGVQRSGRRAASYSQTRQLPR